MLKTRILSALWAAHRQPGGPRLRMLRVTFQMMGHRYPSLTVGQVFVIHSHPQGIRWPSWGPSQLQTKFLLAEGLLGWPDSSQERAALSETLILSFCYLKSSPSARGGSPHSAVQQALTDLAPFPSQAHLGPLPHSCAEPLALHSIMLSLTPCLYTCLLSPPRMLSSPSPPSPPPNMLTSCEKFLLDLQTELRSIFSRSLWTSSSLDASAQAPSHPVAPFLLTPLGIICLCTWPPSS